MNIIVVGCGRVGVELAYRLFKRGHRVTVIDQVASAFINLPADFRGQSVEGEATSEDVLIRAGIQNADGVAVVTNSDPLNAVVAHVARSIFGINNVVVRNYDPNLRSLYETFGLQVISSSSWGAQRLEELLAHVEMRTVFSAGNGEVEVYEFAVPGHWAGHELMELLPETGCSAVSITRAGTAMLPTLDTMMNANDIVLVSATFDGIEAVRKQLLTGVEA